MTSGAAAVAPGERVLVVGGGPIGLLIACVAAAAGARSSSPSRTATGVRWRTRLGLADRSTRRTGDIASTLDPWTGGAGADVAFEVSGSAAGLESGDARAARARPAGRGRDPHQPVPVDLFRVFWRELELIGARVYERRDFERAVELLADGAIPAAELISAVEPLERTPEAFEALESGADVMKVLIDCRASQ